MNNICNYLTENELHTYITTSKENDKYNNLLDLFTDKLDEKYGANTGAKVYTYLSRITQYGNHYGESESLEAILKKQKVLETKIEKIKNDTNLSEERRNNLLKSYNTILNMNIEYYNNLKEKGNETKVEDGFKYLPSNDSNGKQYMKKVVKYKDQQKEELSKFSDFTLNLIKKDFNNISSKQDAQKALVNWNLYKTTCLPTGNGSLGHEKRSSWEAPIQLTSDKAKEVQALLFQKCKETGLLNGNINKKIFNAVLDANINDIQNVKIIRHNHKNKTKKDLYVIDKYAINTLSYSKYDNRYTLENVNEYSDKIVTNLKGEKFDFTNNIKEVALEH